MKILISGATGFVGRALLRHLQKNGHQCLLLTRDPHRTRQQYALGTVSVYSYTDAVPSVDAVINLAGESIVGIWTKRKKMAILSSRVNVTQRIIHLMRQMQPVPKVFISASAVGYYGHRPGEILDEMSIPDPANQFRAIVCFAWENAAIEAEALGIRTTLLRFGQILHPSGGYLRKLLPLFKCGFCFGAGHPNSCFSWVSLEDTVRLMEWVLVTDKVRGPLNVTAPARTTAGEFTRALAAALGRRALGSIPVWLLRLFLGEFASALVDDQNVQPVKAVDAGFHFAHPRLESYFKSLSLRASTIAKPIHD